MLIISGVWTLAAVMKNSVSNLSFYINDSVGFRLGRLKELRSPAAREQPHGSIFLLE
jgi:hypothetical protein